MDFVLWKGSKHGEPWWESPWGNGRPGWHIECSAMSMRFLGPSFDIHGGGKDLVFPHHENEIAQSEAANGCRFVKYWMHNGFVNVNSEKMSKSLGNFFTIRDVLELFDPETLRFFFLQAHYRSPLDYSDQNLKEARAALSRIYEAVAAISSAIADSASLSATSIPASAQELAEKTENLPQRFMEAMDDDFNTAQAVGIMFDGVRAVNRFIAEGGAGYAEGRELLQRTGNALKSAGAVMGLFSSSPEEWLAAREAEKSSRLEISQEEIGRLVEERATARRSKDFAKSDEIRDLLLSKGIQIIDSPQGTTWKLK